MGIVAFFQVARWSRGVVVTVIVLNAGASRESLESIKRFLDEIVDVANGHIVNGVVVMRF